jgi:hypothetical protein
MMPRLVGTSGDFHAGTNTDVCGTARGGNHEPRVSISVQFDIEYGTLALGQEFRKKRTRSQRGCLWHVIHRGEIHYQIITTSDR